MAAPHLSANEPSPNSSTLFDEEKGYDESSSSAASSSTSSTSNPDPHGTPTWPPRHSSLPLTSLARAQPLPPPPHPLPPATPDPPLVTFTSPHDPTNPLTWPLRKKSLTTLLYALTTLTATLSSSIYTPAAPLIAAHFHTNPHLTPLGTTLLLVGFALGPLLWAPLSGRYGHKPAILLPTLGAAVCALAGGAAGKLEILLAWRFGQGVLGAAPQRGVAVVGYAMAVAGGPTLGPILGAAVCGARGLGWRWTQYLSGVFQLGVVGVAFWGVEETYAPVLLVRRAGRLRRETGVWALHAGCEERGGSGGVRELAGRYLGRPFRLLATPVCALMSLYASFVYAILYASLSALPLAFEDLRAWPRFTASLPFLAMLLGMALGAATNLLNQPLYLQRWRANHHRPVPEARLPPMMLGSLLYVAALFAFAWTSATPTTSWLAPCTAIALIGFGIFTIFFAALNYMLDAFPRYAASALAANMFLRSLVAAAFPLFVAPMLRAMGVAWGVSVFGFVAGALVPVPFLFYCYGERIRASGAWSGESVVG
ncbi:hypothetical protein LTR08_001365 [Meristemomyces frigidus]|nr:hypothetical protein LTR08_001365 [Meristemomyces frigidus]